MSDIIIPSRKGGGNDGVAYQYERFTHTWRIINTGSVPWKNRKLVCQNADEITPTAEQMSIELPDTDPNRSATVAVEFDARGEEETFVSKWFMVRTTPMYLRSFTCPAALL